MLAALAETAAECPRLAVTLAGGGLLSLLLQAAAELAGTCGAEQQVGCAVVVAVACFIAGLMLRTQF